MNITRWTLFAIVAGLLLGFVHARGAPPKGAAPVAKDDWYIIEMNGGRAGHMHSREVRERGQVTTSTDMALSIKRGDMAIEISIETQFVETEAGKPVSMTYTRKLGQLPQTTETRWTDDGVEITERQGNSRQTRKAPAPEGKWLTPAAADRHVDEALAKDAKSIVVRTIDPASGLKPVTITRTVLERTTIDVVGRTVPAVKWESTVDSQPGIKSVEWVNERGKALRTEINLGGLMMTIIAADKDLALTKQNPPELLLSTLVTPDKAIAHPRTAKKAVYRLSVKDGELPDIPTLPSQTFERIDAKTGRLTVDATGAAAAPKAEADNADFLSPNAMLNWEDPAVKVLVTNAAPADAKREAVPELARRFVHRFIRTKDMSVGFASASEVAKTRTGDCTEHGVLLAALLRGRSVPSRVVSGLIYVDGPKGSPGFFGYHMWAQALVDGPGGKRWVDLDGTLPDDTPFDATHIILGTSSLTDTDQQNFLVALAPLLGRLQITVEKVE